MTYWCREKVVASWARGLGVCSERVGSFSQGELGLFLGGSFGLGVGGLLGRHVIGRDR